MNKFRSITECPKCTEPRFYIGVDRFRLTYHKSSIDEDLNTCEGVESLFQREHIDVICSKCRYLFIEATDDFNEEEYENTTDMITIPRIEYDELKRKVDNLFSVEIV